MTVKAYLALLVGVFVVALVAVRLVQRNLVGDLAGVARDVTRDHAPTAHAARELRAAHLVERRALAGFLVTAEPAESVRLRQGRRDLQRWRADLGARLGGQEDQTVLAEFDRLVAEEQAAADQAVELRRAGRAADAGERLDELLGQLSEEASRELDADQLSVAVQQLAATTAEQSSGVAQTSATMEELARAAASIAETVDQVASQAGTTPDNLEQAQYDIRASGERTLALADRVGEVGVTIALINEIADQTCPAAGAARSSWSCCPAPAPRRRRPRASRSGGPWPPPRCPWRSRWS
jgi:methyl-accepting chemotaxis protein